MRTRYMLGSVGVCAEREESWWMVEIPFKEIVSQRDSKVELDRPDD